MKPFSLLKVSCLISLLIICQQSNGANLNVTVRDSNNNPVENAVVYINQPIAESTIGTTVIDQVDKEFIPFVTVIRRGNAINFPNNDDIRHQVYSFSNTKQFELSLYKGNKYSPVVFDQSGAVALACNIHDWMTAYVYVVDTDKFVLTNKMG